MFFLIQVEVPEGPGKGKAGPSVVYIDTRFDFSDENQLWAMCHNIKYIGGLAW